MKYYVYRTDDKCGIADSYEEVTQYLTDVSRDIVKSFTNINDAIKYRDSIHPPPPPRVRTFGPRTITMTHLTPQTSQQFHVPLRRAILTKEPREFLYVVASVNGYGIYRNKFKTIVSGHSPVETNDALYTTEYAIIDTIRRYSVNLHVVSTNLEVFYTATRPGRKVAHPEMWKEIDELSAGQNISIEWININKGYPEIDQAARAALDSDN